MKPLVGLEGTFHLHMRKDLSPNALELSQSFHSLRNMKLGFVSKHTMTQLLRLCKGHGAIHSGCDAYLFLFRLYTHRHMHIFAS